MQKGHSRLRELLIHQRNDFEREQAEIRKKTEEETKRKMERFRERERERERVFQQELKRNGGYVTDIMERRRWGFE